MARLTTASDKTNFLFHKKSPPLKEKTVKSRAAFLRIEVLKKASGIYKISN